MIVNTEKVIEWSASRSFVNLDTETTGFCPHLDELRTIQFGDDKNQFILKADELTARDKQQINKHILYNPKITKILHNAKFDIQHLWANGFKIRNVFDTFLAELLLNAGKTKPRSFYGLGNVIKRYTNNNVDKSVQALIHEMDLNDPDAIKYMCDDVKYLHLIAQKQHQILHNLGMASRDHQDINTVLGLENRCVFAFAQIEYTGIKLDLEQWEQITQELVIEVDNIRDELNDMALEILGEEPENPINWNSWQQKRRLLRNIVPDLDSTNERTLTQHKDEHIIFKKLIKYNKSNKLLTAFASKLPTHINEATGRIHPSYWQILNTGRVSCSKPNLQQIPFRS
jgi:twinkle protein